MTKFIHKKKFQFFYKYLEIQFIDLMKMLF